MTEPFRLNEYMTEPHEVPVPVQLLSHVWLFATPWTTARQASLSITSSWSLPKLMSIESVMSSNHLILCRPLLLLHQHQSLFQWVNFFAWGGQSIGVSALASFLPENTEDWSPLGGTGWISLKSKGLSWVFSNTSSEASVLQHSAFFIVQLSHPYITTGKP